jgi:hypothetical protein
MTGAPLIGAGADIITLSKQSRLEWIDVIALDTSVAPIALRVACVISTHFNRKRGDAFLSLKRIAKLTGLSERTVWTAISQLKQAGYLILKGRGTALEAEVGQRGRANEYQPAFDHKRLNATDTGEHLARRCEMLLATSRSQVRDVSPDISQTDVSHLAPGCDPTLNLPTVSNSKRARAREDSRFGEEWKLLRARIGDSAFRFFAEVEIEALSGSVLHLSVPWKLEAAKIRDHYSRDIISVWQSLHPRVERVEVTVRSMTDRSRRGQDDEQKEKPGAKHDAQAEPSTTTRTKQQRETLDEAERAPRPPVDAEDEDNTEAVMRTAREVPVPRMNRLPG